MAKLELPVADACWREVGVRGDRSCARLPAVVHCQNCEVFANAAKTLLNRPASAEYLRELTGFVAEPAETRRAANHTVLMFSLGSEQYAAWTRDVLEVAEAPAPRRVPHRSSQIFRGLVNLQGRLELCLSLRALLGQEDVAPVTAVRQSVLVTAQAGVRWVFAIDALKGMQRVDTSMLMDAPASSARRDNAFLCALLVYQGQRFGVLDLARLSQAAAEYVR